jgi:hypothetical protein
MVECEKERGREGKKNEDGEKQRFFIKIHSDETGRKTIESYMIAKGYLMRLDL